MELIKNIVPVIVAGLIIIIMVLIIKQKRKSNNKVETYMTEGIALGLCGGVAIGASIPNYDYLSYFISFGTLIGFVVGIQLNKRK